MYHESGDFSMKDILDINRMRRLENCEQYIATMRPVFNRRALFTDTSENYLTPAEPEAGDRLKIRFRTAKTMWTISFWYGRTKSI